MYEKHNSKLKFLKQIIKQTIKTIIIIGYFIGFFLIYREKEAFSNYLLIILGYCFIGIGILPSFVTRKWVIIGCAFLLIGFSVAIKGLVGFSIQFDSYAILLVVKCIGSLMLILIAIEVLEKIISSREKMINLKEIYTHEIVGTIVGIEWKHYISCKAYCPIYAIEFNCQKYEIIDRKNPIFQLSSLRSFRRHSIFRSYMYYPKIGEKRRLLINPYNPNDFIEARDFPVSSDFIFLVCFLIFLVFLILKLIFFNINK